MPSTSTPNTLMVITAPERPLVVIGNPNRTVSEFAINGGNPETPPSVSKYTVSTPSASPTRPVTKNDGPAVTVVSTDGRSIVLVGPPAEGPVGGVGKKILSRSLHPSRPALSADNTRPATSFGSPGQPLFMRLKFSRYTEGI